MTWASSLLSGGARGATRNARRAGTEGPQPDSTVASEPTAEA